MLGAVMDATIRDSLANQIESDAVGRVKRPADRLPAEDETAQFAAGRLSAHEATVLPASRFESPRSNRQRQSDGPFFGAILIPSVLNSLSFVVSVQSVFFSPLFHRR